MKKSKTIRQTLDIFVKIFVAFLIVFILYIINENVDLFEYNYFIFPFASIIIIFICGIKVGVSLEKIKDNKSIGLFTKSKHNSRKETKTEFIIKDNYEIITNKKVIKDDDQDKIHIKTFNYDEIDIENEK